MERGDVDLVLVGRLIAKRKWWVLAGSLAGALLLFSASFFLREEFTVTVLLAPAEQLDGRGGSLGSLVGSLGGLGALVGIDASALSDKRKTLAIESLQSTAFAKQVLEKHGYVPMLMAATGWNSASKQIEFDPSVYDAASGKWVREPVAWGSVAPTDSEISKAYKKAVTIVDDKRTGLVVLEVRSVAPDLSMDMAINIVRDFNEYARKKDVEEAERSILFLEQQVSKTDVPEMRSVLYDLIKAQTRVIMLARVREEYAFKVIDPPIRPDKRSSPKRLMLAAAGLILGGILGAWLALAAGIRGSRARVSE